MTTKTIYFNKGAQSIKTVPHRGDRSPMVVASATYGIFDLRPWKTHVVVAEGTAATVDPVSTVLTAKGGRGSESRRNITVASTAGVEPGREYLLTHKDSGVSEMVTIASVASATTLLIDGELASEYPVASTFRGLEVSAVFPEGPANDEANLDGFAFAIVWTFPGVAAPQREPIFVENFQQHVMATVSDLRRLDPLIAAGSDRLGPDSALAQAHEDVRAEIMLAGANPNAMLLGTLGKQACVYRAAALLMVRDPSEHAKTRYKFYIEEYDRIIKAFKIGATRPEVINTDQTTKAQVPSVANFWKWY